MFEQKKNSHLNSILIDKYEILNIIIRFKYVELGCYRPNFPSFCMNGNAGTKMIFLGITVESIPESDKESPT